MRRIWKFGTFFFWPDARESASTVAQAKFAVIETVAVTGTLSRAGSLLAVDSILHRIRLTRWAFIRFGKVP